LAKNGKSFGVCWNCSGKGHVSSKFPSPSTSSNSRLDKKKLPKKDDKHNKHPSGRSDNSANAAVASEEDGVWSAFKLTDLYDNDVSWDHISGYLSNTSSSDALASIPDLQTVSDSSASTASSTPSLCAVSLLMGSRIGDLDWLSEVGDAALSDDLGSQFTETDLTLAMADINPGDQWPLCLQKLSNLLGTLTFMIWDLLSIFPHIATNFLPMKTSHQILHCL
jgi:hypothetical protein